MEVKEKIRKVFQGIRINLMAIYIAYKDKRTPKLLKILCFITVAYAFSPLDLIPDFIPILGQLDDFILIPLAIIILVKLIPKEIYKEAKEKAKNAINEEKPKMYEGIIIVGLLWITIVLAIILPIVL